MCLSRNNVIKYQSGSNSWNISWHPHPKDSIKKWNNITANCIYKHYIVSWKIIKIAIFWTELCKIEIFLSWPYNTYIQIEVRTEGRRKRDITGLWLNVLRLFIFSITWAGTGSPHTLKASQLIRSITYVESKNPTTLSYQESYKGIHVSVACRRWIICLQNLINI